MVDAATKKALSGIPLMKTKAGPRDKEVGCDSQLVIGVTWCTFNNHVTVRRSEVWFWILRLSWELNSYLFRFGPTDSKKNTWAWSSEISWNFVSLHDTIPQVYHEQQGSRQWLVPTWVEQGGYEVVRKVLALSQSAEVRVRCGVRHPCDLPNDKSWDCSTRAGRENSKGGKLKLSCPRRLVTWYFSDVQRGQDLPYWPLQASLG